MILQRLVEYYDRLAADPADPMTPHGFSRESISFAILIEPDGSNPDLVDLRETQGKKHFPRTMTVPDRGGRSGTALKPNFLWDNSGYVLGRDSRAKADRTTQAFESFRQLHVELASIIEDEGLAAVAKFLSAWQPANADSFALLPDAIDKNIAFRIRGRAGFVHESPIIRSAWVQRPPSDNEFVTGQSLISGDNGPLARLHPMISGVTGAQTMGAAIASFNAKAYESYGKEQTFNSPVSVADAFKYTTALNRLLEGRSHRFGLGDATVVFWADRPTPLETFASEILADIPGPPADAPAEDKLRAEQVRRFLSQLREGHQSEEAVNAEGKVGFYIAGLSPNASRISVRFWIDSTVGEMKARLARHMADTEMTGAREDDPPLMIRRIVAATGRAESDRGRFKGYDAGAVSPLLAGAIARAVLTGGPYPQSLLATLINRIKADGSIRHERVAAIKAVIVRNSRLQKQPKEVPVALDPDRTDPAYVTGRLFALLEKIQSDSLGGDLNATIKDRYFSAASATPGLVFPRLIRLSQHHLAKLETGQKIYYERLLGEAIGKLQSFASHLMLEDQGLFAIGYFHQRQSLFTPKKKEAEAA